MENQRICPDISEEDLRSALAEQKTFVDITVEDLMKIYVLATRHARTRLALKIPVHAVMTGSVICTSRETDLYEVARLMSENRISGMPVVDDENRVVGVISEADILVLAGMKKGHTFRDVLHHLLGEPTPVKKEGDRVGDVMSTPPITTGPDADIREVAAILDERRIKRLPVVDRAGRLIGIVSRADIIRAMGKRP
jgi:CBS domain-containing protein